jgi:hypothetical protein
MKQLIGNYVFVDTAASTFADKLSLGSSTASSINVFFY